MRIAATFTTTPSCGAAGSTNCVGTTTSRPTPGSQGSTPGFAVQDFLVAHIEAPRDVGQRVVLADGGLLHIAHDVAARASTSKRCVAVGLGSTGAGGGEALATGGGAAARGETMNSRRCRARSRPHRPREAPCETQPLESAVMGSIYSKVGRSGNWLRSNRPGRRPGGK